jgi:UDP:flavonoid glycosyltransferase YjiC (YdhE family)
MHRSHWSETELAGRLNFILHDQAMKQKLAATAAVMRKQPGPEKAARLLNQLLTGKA